MTAPRHYLVLPADWVRRYDVPEREPLTWTADHSSSSYGHGVMLDEDGHVLDGQTFRNLRDGIGCWIETDQPEKVCAALGLPQGEPGIRRSIETSTVV